MPKKSIAVYVRVSTESQNLAGQIEAIKRWLSGHGIESDEVRWFIDKKSGDGLNRKGFQRLQASIFHGDIGTVVVYKLDRISRKLKDGINTICEWCEQGLRVVSITQEIDFSGTVGKMIAAVLLGVAEIEQEHRRERQADGIRVAKAEGKYRGRKKGTFKAKPERARKLREQGLKSEEIARSLGVSKVTIFRYLRTN